MGLHKLTAGDGYTYLTRQVAAHDSTEKGHTSLGDYYEQKGESPGAWVGSGLSGLGMIAGERVSAEQMKALFGEGRHPNAKAVEDAIVGEGGSSAAALKASGLGRAFAVYDGANPFQVEVARRFTAWNTRLGVKWDAAIPAEDRARIRTETGKAMFAQEFGRPPANARELSGFIARASRQPTTAVAGYDLTFSPVKSVSALWAIAPREVAEQIEAAHHAAVTGTLRWLETEASYTRTGRAGVRQVEVNGLIAASFTHRDSRSGDPDLHTHVAVSNKVQTLDGRWLALDGRVLYKANVSASERYNTRLEAELIARLGVQFGERQEPDHGKRPIREIVGMSPDLNAFWSSRRAAIENRRGELANQFQTDHGRPPTDIEAIALAQQATLETRADKHSPRSFAEQRAAWRDQAIGVLGSPHAITRMIASATARKPGPARLITDDFVRQSAVTVLGVVASSRATWQLWHIRAEAERQARHAGVALKDLDTVVDRVVEQALSPGSSIPLGAQDPIEEPDPLRRRDGSSVYLVAGSKLYTSRDVIDAERGLLAAALRHDGRTISGTQVDIALTEPTTNQLELNPAQAQMVRELATSGARVQLAIAPAGSGKTTAMRTLARAWTGSGGDVIGLAPSARAAADLSREIQRRSETLAKLTWSLTNGATPGWVRDIGTKTLVIIDEAGMAGTADLAQAVDYIIGRGGSVRLVGDDQQLASIAAGGVLRDIAEQAGAVTLSELHRFADPAEGAATLALRLGDPAGLGFYLDNQRVHVGDETTVTNDAYQAWSADRANGLDAVMLAPTRDLVSVLNARARTDRLASSDEPAGREVLLADGNRASAGDTITTRMNNRELPISGSDWVKNGDRWRVAEVQRSGALVAVHLDTNRKITLPAAYVREHTELGYACTVHAAQGITAGTCHTVATGDEARQLFYVAMTRGRKANHVYLVTASDGDQHNIIKPETLFPPTATDILTGVLERDQAQKSAASTTLELEDPALLLHDAASRYQDALGFAAEQLTGTNTLTALDEAAEQLRPGLTTAPAYPTLRAHLTLLSAAGADPIALLRSAAGEQARELDTALDPAAVLDWRLDPTGLHSGGSGPLPWLPAVPAALATNPQWGDYLTTRAARVAELAVQLRAQSADWTPTTAPTWATRLLDPAHDQLRADLALWRAANAIPDHDRRPTGRPQPAAAATRYQNDLQIRLQSVLGDPGQATTAWAPLVNRIDPRISTDTYWPELADRLAAMERAGLDVPAMLTTVATGQQLPDEQPAAALWWRLSRHLSPAATAATSQSPASTLRPSWTPILFEQLGTGSAQRVLADPAWPALVAAISSAPPGEWTPEQLLTTAIDLTLAGRTTTGQQIADPDLAPALIWRVAMLTDPAPLEYEDTPPDPDDTELAPPDDLHLLDLPADPASPETAPNSGYDLPPEDPSTTPAPPEDEQLNRGEAASPQLQRAIHAANVLRGPLEPTEAEQWAALDEEHKWATAPVAKARLLELNQHALKYFTANYSRSWGPRYLHDRLGTDLAGDERFTPGYAPAGWTHLTNHLRRLGATDQEILAAGLGRSASTGGVIDQFRDRLIFPIYHGDEIHGFIGRRNPLHDDGAGARSGPKYLNTARTDLFDKSAQLFGLHEGRASLAAGATPVLVEGPIDAIAITIGTSGTHVGVAPLGTAFTDTQAGQLARYIGSGNPGILVATDADQAGWKAAQRAYWQLTVRGDNPRHVLMPADFDPAALLENGGPAAVQQTLAQSQPLARILIEELIDSHAGQPRGKDRRVAIRTAAEIIAALPPDCWLEPIDYVTNRLDTPADAVQLAVIDAGDAWAQDPRGLSQQHIRAIQGGAPPRTLTSTIRPAGYTSQTRHSPHATQLPLPDGLPSPDLPQPYIGESGEPEQETPGDRWRALADSIDPRLPLDSGWIALAATLGQAAAAGMNVEHQLPRIATEGAPLPEYQTAMELRYRVIAASAIDPDSYAANEPDPEPTNRNRRPPPPDLTAPAHHRPQAPRR
jgi:DNA primase catalytic core